MPSTVEMLAAVFEASSIRIRPRTTGIWRLSSTATASLATSNVTPICRKRSMSVEARLTVN